MGPGGRAGRVSGGSLPGRGLALARSNSAVAIALAWLARGSAKSPAAARAAIPEVEAFCADTGRNTPLAAEAAVGLCCTGTTLAMRRHELADEASAFDRQTTTARTRPRISARPLRRRGDDADEPSNGTSAVRSWRPVGRGLPRPPRRLARRGTVAVGAVMMAWPGVNGINGIYRRDRMALHDDADAYRQVKDAWRDATEARQIIMLDDLRDLLDGIGFADDDEYELREKIERLITDIEDDLGIDESGQ